MKVSLATLRTIQQSNVVEIKFARRRLKPGFAATRRMLCTGCLPLLNSPEGRIALNFRPAYNRPKYTNEPKNLLITWDIFMQDYRMINMNACELLGLVPSKDFWRFFNEKLAKLSASQKLAFMNA